MLLKELSPMALQGKEYLVGVVGGEHGLFAIKDNIMLYYECSDHSHNLIDSTFKYNPTHR